MMLYCRIINILHPINSVFLKLFALFQNYVTLYHTPLPWISPFCYFQLIKVTHFLYGLQHAAMSIFNLHCFISVLFLIHAFIYIFCLRRTATQAFPNGKLHSFGPTCDTDIFLIIFL